jgi:hypothetical protein
MPHLLMPDDILVRTHYGLLQVGMQVKAEFVVRDACALYGKRSAVGLPAFSLQPSAFSLQPSAFSR